ncbi:hypothetical protein F3J29_09865 [Enterobacter sp. Cy-643]|uniref:GPW/gp25 family protein n=1 Tax=Enterobacter sp. Cy-643 TaxID=2608346 RepID=UPI0014201524|nr:GPW/gp25 family protein [Enterobacter sp. Cy-643]NIF32444.1 hypothetical protein [Enterobacter sp. Cy-643]
MSSLLCRLSDNHPLSIEDDYACDADIIAPMISDLKMLLTSRTRLPMVEEIPLVNASIINYGINESFGSKIEMISRDKIMTSRISNALLRFEPRLVDVFITRKSNPEAVIFILQASYRHTPFRLEMIWDDSTGRFFFDE